jgi:hypothetical protein
MKHLKLFNENWEQWDISGRTNEASIRDRLYNASTMITGKPKIWQQNREKAERLTKQIVGKLKEMGFDVEDTNGIMTDGATVYGIRVPARISVFTHGRNPKLNWPDFEKYFGPHKYTISLMPKYNEYDRRISIKLDIYGATSDFVDTHGNTYQGGEEVLIDENDLAMSVNDVASAIIGMSRYNVHVNDLRPGETVGIHRPK